ncbi:PREDICTED: uncharacterized protein LOC104826192 [Tarenaya hassleriana]|uniref:uncharacterized protein LOC104826192 n=1 Tax=Tarenaya hassleriana TaxID=28532 RepID=UPI00053C3BBA|nr:PREDICTED: uncharacterized protein LOC104826192 [Tarenaya hassleriana]
MGFTGTKDGSHGFVKRVASSFSNMRRKKNSVEPKGLPRSKSTGANFESMRIPTKKNTVESAGVSPRPRRGKIDGHEKQKFSKLRCFDDSDSIWLSSDCASPTSFLEEHRLSVSFHFSVDESVVSWLSNLANSSPSLNLGANSIKDRRRKKLDCSVSWNVKEKDEDAKKEASKVGKIRTSDGNPVGTGRGKQSTHCPGGNKTCSKNLSEQSDSSNSNSNSSSLDSSSQTTEEEKVNFSASSGTNSESESSTDPNITTESSSVEDSEVLDSKKRNVVEPLFWPFEQIFDWTPEDILKHFSMSPRKKKSLGAKTSSGTSPRSMRQQLHLRKLDFKEGCRRKLVFNGPLPKNSKIRELKRTISNSSRNSKKSDTDKDSMINDSKNGIKRNKSLPSRLRNSSKISSKVVPIEVAEEAAETAKEKSTTRKLIIRKSRTFLEDDFAFINDLSIEKAVGLDEFKGREGIDSDFNGEIFLLDDSL